MAQQVKVPATKPEDLSLIPESRMVEEENRLIQVLSFSLTCSHVVSCLFSKQANKQTKCEMSDSFWKL